MPKIRKRKRRIKKKEEGLISRDLLEAGFDSTVSPKNLRMSREFKADFIQKFGDNLCSILRYDGKIKHTDLSRIKRGGGYAESQNKNKETFSKGLSAFSKTGFIARDRKNYLSTFPMNVGRQIVGLYAPDHCQVYDPFAGHNSRMELCYNMGHHYTGVDICAEFMEANRTIRDMLVKAQDRRLLKNTQSITLYEQSSENVEQCKDDAYDFTITSPPYWDIENYGPEDEQLGIGKTYEEFLEGLGRCAVENFRVLKPGAFCCWFINDFRKNGKFYAYHIDTYNTLCMAGFDPFNIYIVDLKNTPNKAFVRWIVKTRILPKQHEYCIVVRKPEV